MPFTVEQFFQIFEKYNVAIFPMQIVLLWMAFVIVWLILRPKVFSSQLTAALLGVLWIWTGFIYHLIFFTQINSAAYFFALMFILQSVLFFYEGVAKKHLSFRFEMNSYGIIGAIIIVYALLIYPLISYLSGRIYPASPTFGAPCPMTIFTFGLLLWTEKKISLRLLVIPLLWTFIGSFAFLMFGVKEDFGLLATGILATFLLFRRNFIAREVTNRANAKPQTS